MGILFGLFIIAMIIVLYKIMTTAIPDESYLTPKVVKYKEKPVEEHFEDTLSSEDFVSKEQIKEVNDHVKEIIGEKPPKKHLQKTKRKSSVKSVKDK